MGLGRKRKEPRGDPWRRALDRHIAGEPTEPLPRADVPAPRPRRRGLLVGLLAGGAAVIVALLAGGGYLGYVAMENHERADDWQDRSSEFEVLVVDRTKALNRQTVRLNRAATRLREARLAISRSEEDVAQLEARQRELANEKAQVEDQRAFLEGQRALLETQLGDLAGVANQVITCASGLSELRDIYGSQNFPDPYYEQTVFDDCGLARGAIDSYEAEYSGQ